MTMGPGMDNRWMDNKDKEEGWIRRWMTMGPGMDNGWMMDNGRIARTELRIRTTMDKPMDNGRIARTELRIRMTHKRRWIAART